MHQAQLSAPHPERCPCSSPQLVPLPPWSAQLAEGRSGGNTTGFMLVYESGNKFPFNAFNCTKGKPPKYPDFGYRTALLVRLIIVPPASTIAAARRKSQKRAGLAFGPTPTGPWTRLPAPLLHLPDEADQRNPTLAAHRNGTLILIYRTNTAGYDAAVSSSWRGPWQRIAKAVQAPLCAEDPYVYFDEVHHDVLRYAQLPDLAPDVG